MPVAEKVLSLLKALETEGSITKEDYEWDPAHSLSRLTTFRTGGKAAVFFPKKEAALIKVVPLLKKENIPYFILGNGSNVIARDEGYHGVVLCLSRLNEVHVSGNEVIAGAGASITALSLAAQKNALSGMEFFYGIPGSVGGAVFMNAGAYGGECKDVLKEVTVLSSDGEVNVLGVEKLKMGYRTSVFEERDDVILSATFSLKKGEKTEIRKTMDALMAKRVEKQPLDYPSAGSTFKRLEGHFTAQLIDEAGLKGFRVGGAMVSEKHAGFVINYQNATSEDILAVIERVRQVIFQTKGLWIQREVRILE